MPRVGLLLLVVCTVDAWSPVSVTHVGPTMTPRCHVVRHVAVAANMVLPRQVMLASARRTLRADLQDYFSSVDLDGNGVLDRNEFHTAVAQRVSGVIPRMATDRLFDEVDTDGSGDISYDEYVGWMWQQLYPAAVRVDGDAHDVLHDMYEAFSSTAGAEVNDLGVQLTRAACTELRARNRALVRPSAVAVPAVPLIVTIAERTFEFMGMSVIVGTGVVMLNFMQYDAAAGIDGNGVNFQVYNTLAALAGDELTLY